MADQQDGGEREPQPIDEEAAWAAIVAAYGEEPADPPGARPFRPIQNLALPEPEAETGGEARPGAGAKPVKDPKSLGDPKVVAEVNPVPGPEAPVAGAGSGSESAGDAVAAPGVEKEDGDGPGPAAGRPALGSSVVFAPGVGPSGPRDYTPAPSDDEGHFVPPEPPPLPEADATTKFAWLGVVGGPVLMLLAVLLRWDMTWWLTTLCVGGFLGGFVTLVARMKHDDEDDDGFGDPGRGAVV
ncbi:hypothetical protein [Streptomyces sp. NPDC126503]|uniref:hypothetical protein n=1 Tax=Streptomyces sp. NPDC126503 TaxID=3155315 RepID=UPI00332A7FC8